MLPKHTLFKVLHYILAKFKNHHLYFFYSQIPVPVHTSMGDPRSLSVLRFSDVRAH